MQNADCSQYLCFGVAAPWGRRSRCGCPMIPKPLEVVLWWSSRSPRCTFCWQTSRSGLGAGWVSLFLALSLLVFTVCSTYRKQWQ